MNRPNHEFMRPAYDEWDRIQDIEQMMPKENALKWAQQTYDIYRSSMGYGLRKFAGYRKHYIKSCWILRRYIREHRATFSH